MDMQHIPLEQLKISSVNMRHGRKKPRLDDILPSIRAHGVLVPLLVRPNGKNNEFEIVAGRRRFFALKTIEKETGEAQDLPCRILAAGDDAAAIEASILENTARLEPGEMQEFEAFKALKKKGRSIGEIANIFGVTKLTVRRRLALANLIPAIRRAYVQGNLDSASLTALTLASKAQQREWLAMFNSKDMRAPRGRELKRWLLGGGEIATSTALFSLDDYHGSIFEDLFGERSVFGSADEFWPHQDTAIATEQDKLLANGWTKVAVLERGAFFSKWDYAEITKKDGGEVFIEVRHFGEVIIHKGYAPRKHEKAKAKKPADKPECSAPLENYIDLHRHAAARAMLLKHQGIALRLLAAHLMVGAPNIRAAADPQRTRKEGTAASVAASTSQQVIDIERTEIAALLGGNKDRVVTSGNGDGYQLAAVFAKLMKLNDADVTRILTYIMAETLSAGHEGVECVGACLSIDMSKLWKPDDAFFELLRDKKVVNALLGDIGGKSVAKANCKATGKIQKQIIRDHLDGANGREAKSSWRPKWMAFPARSYAKTGAPGAAQRTTKIADLFKT